VFQTQPGTFPYPLHILPACTTVSGLPLGHTVLPNSSTSKA
jgi:hypothetical protein